MSNGFVSLRRAEAALLDEKANKLLGIARLLGARLTPEALALLDPSRQWAAGHESAVVSKLNRALAPIADEVACAFQGVGVGYYALCVDRIVAYAPSSQFGDKVGTHVWPGHIGRQAMREKREIVGVGSMVRGDIMNCVRPLIRGDRVIGFAWANEALEDIYQQIQRCEQNLFFSRGLTDALASLTGLLVLCTREFGRTKSCPQDQTEAETSALDRLFPIRCRLEMFLNSLYVGVVVLDHLGRSLFLNTKARELLQKVGIEANNLVGLGALQLGFPDLRQQFAEMQKQGITQVFLRHVSPTTTQELELSLVRLEEAGTPWFLLIIEDPGQVKEREDYEARAARLAAAGEVAVAFAHEIRNPLAIIRGSVRLLPDRLYDREFLVRLSEVLRQEIDHVNSTLEGLLAFARVTEPRFETVNLTALLTSTVRLLEPYAGSQGVEVSLDVPDEEVYVEGDPTHIRQALLNLMVNSVQAMPDGGALRVQCSRRPGSNLVELVVEDTGTGIPRADQAKVFDLSFTRRPGGAGLGLALVQRIIDEHQGFIRLESDVGKGTRFIITLPVRRYYLRRC